MNKNNKKLYKIVLTFFLSNFLSNITLVSIYAADEAPPAPNIGEDEANEIIKDTANWPKGATVKIEGQTSNINPDQLIAALKADPSLSVFSTITLTLPSGAQVGLSSKKYADWRTNNFVGDPVKVTPTPGGGPIPTQGQPTPGPGPKPGIPNIPGNVDPAKKAFEEKITFIIKFYNKLNNQKSTLDEKSEALARIQENLSKIDPKKFDELIDDKDLKKLKEALPEDINSIAKIRAFIDNNKKTIDEAERIRSSKEFEKNINDLIAKYAKILSATEIKEKEAALAALKVIFARINPKEFQTLIPQLGIKIEPQINEISKIKDFISNQELMLKTEKEQSYKDDIAKYNQAIGNDVFNKKAVNDEERYYIEQILKKLQEQVNDDEFKKQVIKKLNPPMNNISALKKWIADKRKNFPAMGLQAWLSLANKVEAARKKSNLPEKLFSLSVSLNSLVRK